MNDTDLKIEKLFDYQRGLLPYQVRGMSRVQIFLKVIS